MARKTPQQKKAESLSKDRRNVYGENSKASRKLVPKSKALSHRAERRVAREGLRVDGGEVDLEAADRAEVRRQVVAQHAFKKVPDAPLGQVLAEKAARKVRRAAR